MNRTTGATGNEKFTAAIESIAASCSRGKANFAIAPSSGVAGPFVLVAGSIRLLRIPNGYMVQMRVTRERLLALRAQIDELLIDDVVDGTT